MIIRVSTDLTVCLCGLSPTLSSSTLAPAMVGKVAAALAQILAESWGDTSVIQSLYCRVPPTVTHLNMEHGCKLVKMFR